MRLRASARAAPGTRNRTTTVEHDAFGLEPALGTQTLADRSSVFFYGTLTDPDVLQRVLARRTEGELEPAWVDSFRRVQAMVASYPLLLPASGTSVPGLLLRHPSRSDIARLNHFESGEYRAERHTVRLEDGSRLRGLALRGPAALRLRASSPGTSPLGSSSTRRPSSPNATPGWPTAPSPTEPCPGPGRLN